MYRGFVLVLVIVIAVCNGQIEECGTCPDAWTYFQESCYLFSDNLRVSWTEAAHHCEVHKSHLVVIDNKQEDLFLQDYASKLFKNVVDRHTYQSAFWTGATDETVEGLWTWYTDNSALTYTNWEPGQPDSHMGWDEDCMYLYGELNFTWNDAPCYQKRHPLCELHIREESAIIG